MHYSRMLLVSVFAAILSAGLVPEAESRFAGRARLYSPSRTYEPGYDRIYEPGYGRSYQFNSRQLQELLRDNPVLIWSLPKGVEQITVSPQGDLVARDRDGQWWKFHEQRWIKIDPSVRSSRNLMREQFDDRVHPIPEEHFSRRRYDLWYKYGPGEWLHAPRSSESPLDFRFREHLNLNPESRRGGLLGSGGSPQSQARSVDRSVTELIALGQYATALAHIEGAYRKNQTIGSRQDATLRLCEYVSRFHLAREDRAYQFQIGLRYLNEREFLLSATDSSTRAQLLVAEQQILKLLAENAGRAAEGKLGTSNQPAVLDTWESGGQDYITLATTGGSGGGKGRPPVLVSPMPEEPKREPKRDGGTRRSDERGQFNAGIHTITFMAGRFLVLDLHKARAEHEKRVTQIIQKNSTNEMQLFNVTRVKGGYEVEFPNGKISVNEEEVKRLRAGQPLSEDHALVQRLAVQTGAAVLLNTRVLEWDKKGRQQAQRFAFALSRQATAKVYRDVFTAQTPDKVAQLNARTVGSPSDYVAIVADKSFKVKDFGIVQDLESSLRDAGVAVHRFRRGEAKAFNVGVNKNVLIITANSDKQLKAFIDELGRAGVLRDNYIILVACEAPATMDVLERINQLHGAKATYTYEGKIDYPNAMEFVERLSKELISIDPASAFTDEIRRFTIDSKLNGMWVVSEVKKAIRSQREFPYA
jgi:hypothetical protein